MTRNSLRKLTVLVAATAVAGMLAASQSVAQKAAAAPAYEVVPVSKVVWGALNPLRGKNGPRAANLWGDRAGSGATGFIVRFQDGFSSPPHIHNVTYRALVISGQIYNGGSRAAKMWMSPGSYWTQPAGASHITAARGSSNIAYVEIASGPYLVRPVAKAFGSADKPINVDASNIVWVDQPGGTAGAPRPKVAYLWGDPADAKASGRLVKLPAGFKGRVRSHGASLRAVVIQGRSLHRAPGQSRTHTLDAGSYFGSTGKAGHHVACVAGTDCILYLRAEGQVDITAAPAAR